jgi:hypothetical protein
VTASLPRFCRVTDVDLQIDIGTLWSSDLDVYLSHDEVVDSELFTDVCGNDDNIQAILDDDAAERIGSVCPVADFNRYATESGAGLNAFDGERGDGDWILRVDDDFGPSISTLEDWVLRIETEGVAPEP